MASPQLENGYTKIANELYDEICRWKFSAYEFRILIFIIRKTYGWNKKEDWISLSQFMNGTGIRQSHICRTISLLMQQNIITKGGNRTMPKYSIQKDFTQWIKLPKGVKSHHELQKGVIESVKGGNLTCKRGDIQKKLLQNKILQKKEEIDDALEITKGGNLEIELENPVGYNLTPTETKKPTIEKSSLVQKSLPASEIINLWNTHCGQLSKKKTSTKQIDHCWKETQKKFTLEEITKAIQKASSTPFCCGTNTLGWKLTLDVFLRDTIKSGCTIAKILEGFYDREFKFGEQNAKPKREDNIANLERAVEQIRREQEQEQQDRLAQMD